MLNNTLEKASKWFDFSHFSFRFIFNPKEWESLRYIILEYKYHNKSGEDDYSRIGREAVGNFSAERISKVVFKETNWIVDSDDKDYIASDEDYVQLLDDYTKILQMQNEFDEIQATFEKYLKRKKDANSAYNSRDTKDDNLKYRAKQEYYDKVPGVSENAYAKWQSKNGPRRVTVLSIDEPNHRAKINTDKGATMYVPLSTLFGDSKETMDEFYNRLRDAGVPFSYYEKEDY